MSIVMKKIEPEFLTQNKLQFILGKQYTYHVYSGKQGRLADLPAYTAECKLVKYSSSNE